MANKKSKPVVKKKNGRPSSYSIDMDNKICNAIATSSIGLKHIAKNLGIDPSTIYDWLNKHPNFAERYARARDAQADLMAEEILDIADDASNDFMTIVKGDKTYETENKEVTNRSRLRIDARKWLASKLKPKKYGDKLDVTTDGEKVSSFVIGFNKPDEATD